MGYEAQHNISIKEVEVRKRTCKKKNMFTVNPLD